MDLLDRYLAAVSALLPKTQREDIVAELRDLLLNRIEEQEARLDRPLTAGEREAVLKAFGHPIAVAGRFGAPRSLVGPELYPFWLFGVKALLVIAAILAAIPAVVTLLAHPGEGARALAGFLNSFITTGLTLIGAATLVGAGVERGWIRLGRADDWKVADLPDLHPKGALQRRFEALFEVIVAVLFILWWTGTVPAPWTNAQVPDGLGVRPAAVWAGLYLPVLALAVLQAASSLVSLARPDLARLKAGLELAGDLGGLAVAAVLWRAGRLVTVTLDPGGPAADAARLQLVIDHALRISLTVFTVICAVKLALDAWRLLRGAPSARRATA